VLLFRFPFSLFLPFYSPSLYTLTRWFIFSSSVLLLKIFLQFLLSIIPYKLFPVYLYLPLSLSSLATSLTFFCVFFLQLTITVNMCKLCRNRKVVFKVKTAHRWRFFDISAKNLLTSGVVFGNKAGKLPILANVKCCSCLFYKFSPFSDNNNKMHNYGSNV
jgi:hypothetical protein